MAARFLLDTNICIYIAKQHPPKVYERFKKLVPGDIGMSLITFGELYYGAEKSHFQQQALKTLLQLIELIPVAPFSIKVAEHYGQIRNFLEKKGSLIGNNDLWIAAHARALDVILVTNNLRAFKRVPKLKIENWVD